MFHDKSLQSVGIDSAIRSRVRFPPVRYHFFPIKSVQTISSSKGDMSYLHEGKKKEHSRERERKRERERERVCKTCKILARPF